MTSEELNIHIEGDDINHYITRWNKKQEDTYPVISDRGPIHGPTIPVCFLNENDFNKIWPPQPCPKEFVRFLDGYWDRFNSPNSIKKRSSGQRTFDDERRSRDFDFDPYFDKGPYNCRPFIVYVSDIEYDPLKQQYPDIIKYPGIYIRGSIKDYQSSTGKANLLFGVHYIQNEITKYFMMPRSYLVKEQNRNLSFIHALDTLFHLDSADQLTVIANSKLVGIWAIPISLYHLFFHELYFSGSTKNDAIKTIKKKLYDRLNEGIPRNIYIDEYPHWYEDIEDIIDELLHTWL